MRFILFIVLIALTSAEVPQQHSLNRYSRLWRESPFTVKPIIQAKEKTNELNNYVLLGVSTNPLGGHTVTIMDKRDRTKRRRIHSTGSYNEQESQGYKILDISRKGLNYKETRVRVSYGDNTAWLGYDEKVLAVKPKPVVKQPPRAPQPNIQNPKQNQNQNTNTSGTPLPPGLNLNDTTQKPKASAPTTRRPRIRRIVKPKK